MASNPAITLSLRAENTDLIAKVRISQAALQALGASASAASVQTSAGASRATQAVASFAQSLRNAANQAIALNRQGVGLLGTLSSLARGAAAFGGVGFGVLVAKQYLTALTDMSDAYTNLTSKIKNVTANENELVSVRSRVLAISQQTRTSFESTTVLYARMARATADLNISQDRLLRMTETINKGFLVSGSTMQEANSALIQLSQGLASGVLRGDEFNSVAEQAPIILDALSKSLGRTRAELRSMAEAGQLTTDILVTALESGAADIDRQFANVALTVSSSTVLLRNAATEFVGSNYLIQTAMQALISSMKFLADNFELIATAAGVAALALTSFAVAGIGRLVLAAAGGAAGLQAMAAAFIATGSSVGLLKAAMLGLLASPAGIIFTLAGGTILTFYAFKAYVEATEEAQKLIDSMGAARTEAINVEIRVSTGDDVGANEIEATLKRVRGELDSHWQVLDKIRARQDELRDSAYLTNGVIKEFSDLEAKASKIMEEQKGLLASLVSLTDLLTDARKRQQQAIDVRRATDEYEKDSKKMIAAFEREAFAFGKSREQMAAYDLEVAKSAITTELYGVNADAAKEKIDQMGQAVLSAAQKADAAAAAHEAMQEGIRLAKERAEEAERAAQQLSEAYRENEVAMRGLQGGLDGVTSAQAEYNAAEEQALQDMEARIALGMDAETAYRRYTLEVRQAAKALAEENAERERAINILGRMKETYNQEIYLAQFSSEQRRIEADVLSAVNDRMELVRQGMEGAHPLTLQEIEDIRNLVTQHYRAIEALERIQQANEDWKNIGIQTAQGLSQAWGNWVSRGLRDFKGFAEEVKNVFKQMLANMVAQVAYSKLFDVFKGMFGGGAGTLNLGGLFGGSGSGLLSLFGGGGASGVAGGGQNLLGSLGGLSDSVRNLASTIGGWFGIGGSGALTAASANLGAVGIGGMGSITGSGLAGLGGSVGTFSGAGAGGSAAGFMGIPVVGWIMAGMMANDSLFGSGWKPNGGSLTLPNGQSVSGGGSGFGRTLDRMFDPLGILGDRIASLLSGSATITRLFGRKAPELQSGTTTYSFGPDGPGGSEQYRTIERGGVFRSDRRRTHNFDLGDEAQEAVEALFDQIRQQIESDARQLKGEAPDMISAAIRAVSEYDKKGKIKSTKYFVDILGRTWEEESMEDAQLRVFAEARIATIDSILRGIVDTTAAAAEASGQEGAGAAEQVTEASGRVLGTVGDMLVKTVAGVQGEASAIAERWRDDAQLLAQGAEFLLAAAIDMREGNGLLGDGGTLTQIADLIEELQQPGESLTQTYVRVVASTQMLEEALGLMNVSFTSTREEFVRFATEITEAAGGLERATQLWSSYFDTFYTEQERLTYAIEQARQRAGSQFGDIGLDFGQFEGEGGLAAFRRAFEAILPSLDPEQIVQWLEAGQALGAFTNLMGELEGATGQASGSLVEFMGEIKEELAAFAPPETFAQRMARINTETETLIERARELGATEEDIATIRLLGANRLTEVLQEQAAAVEEYRAYVTGVYDQLAELRGQSEFQTELRNISRWLRTTVDEMNAAARAAGMQAAAESDLAAAHEVAALRVAQAIAQLEERGRSIVEELYGSQLERLETELNTMQNGVGTWMSTATSGMGEVQEATENAIEAQISAQERIREWLDGIMSSDLGGLRPRDQLRESQELFNRTLAEALAGDADAMNRLPQIADELLRLGRRVYASGDPYFDLRDSIIAAMRQVTELVFTPPPDTGSNGGGGGGGGGVGGGGSVVDEEARAAARREAEAAQRRELAMELTGIIRDMMSVNQRPLEEIETQLGFSMEELVADLGVNLEELTAATSVRLADIAQAMGVELTDLASSVGVDLGQLASAQSLLNDALEAEIASLPEGQRALLEPLLRDVEEAAARGDTAGVEAGILDMEEAIRGMDTDIRDALAPFFDNIEPANPETQISHLADIDTSMIGLLAEAVAQTGYLATIAGNIGLYPPPTSGGVLVPGGGFGGGSTVPPPGYAVGTPWVPSDGLAFLHEGEAVIPAAVNKKLRKASSEIASDTRPPEDTNALLRELIEITKAQALKIEKLEQALSGGAARISASIERSNDRAPVRRL